MAMITFCQQDYPQKLGTSNFTIARYGCLLTAITMGYDWFFNQQLTPPQIDAKLSFDANGMLLWGSLSNIGLQLKNRVQGRNDAVMQAAIKDPKLICCIQVKNSHWVLALSKRMLGGYNIQDPWTGLKSTTSAYGEQITGCAIISRI